jgi:hypothetical protein
VKIFLYGRSYFAHALAVLYRTGEHVPEGMVVDHIEGNRADNRWNMLRVISASQNAINSKTYRNNTSGFKGVSFHKGVKKFQARLTIEGQTLFGGFHDTAEEAYFHYCILADAFHGEYART